MVLLAATPRRPAAFPGQHPSQTAGQSIQAYMRDQVTDMARRRTKEEAWAAVESALAAEASPGPAAEDVLADLTRDRR